jgi:hypothetical protein
MKPLNVCKSSSLARIIPLEEPLDSSEPKDNQLPDSAKIKGFRLPPGVGQLIILIPCFRCITALDF